MQNVQPYWTTVQTYFSDAFDYAHHGFTQVNLALGIIVAFIAAFTLGQYRLRAIVVSTLGATVLFLVAEYFLIPAVEGHGRLAMPDVMTSTFWHQVPLVIVGLFLMITVLYVLKKAFLRGGGH